MKKQIMDGCTAASHVAFAMSEVATIYPITPIASMGQTALKWGLEGRRNLWDQPLLVKEMESELGAAGAVHGAAAAGALSTTFTSSQGLMLMIPNMYKIAGELLPVVFHVGCRSLATHALSIFGDHQDVMACRATGFAMLASASVQETMDMALVAHLAAIKGSLPVLHFFDGWRTSSEMNSIEVIDYETIRRLTDMSAVNTFRRRGMNPDHPNLRGSAQNADVYFQNREAANNYYDRFPTIVQGAMNSVAQATGRQYHTVDYYGVPDARLVIVVMASAADVVRETVEYLNTLPDYKVGVVVVRLYRPFPVHRLQAVIPHTTQAIAVLDRTKEPGAQHEPLCQDVIAALRGKGSPLGNKTKIIGGRYGLSSKEFDPAMVKAVFDELAKQNPKTEFTVGINDDVTGLSLTIGSVLPVNDDLKKSYQAIFYAIGNDGTVGGTKQVATIIGNTSQLYAQAYFSYSAKKSGGYTISQLRVSSHPITAAYSINQADYVACHKPTYVNRFEMLDKIKSGGTFVINCPWSDEQLTTHLPLAMRRRISQLNINLYVIDADAIAARLHLSPRVNMPLEAVYLKLSNILPYDQAVTGLKQQIAINYSHEGTDVVQRNCTAVDQAADALRHIDYSKIHGWDTVPEISNKKPVVYANTDLKRFITQVHTPCIKGLGDSIPVSALTPDGTMPMGTTAYEHRRIATRIPVWDAGKCVECCECSLVCAHAAIRPFILSDTEEAMTPPQFATKPAKGTPELKSYHFRIQVYPEDCLGCASCSLICPGHALTMTPASQVMQQEIQLLDWAKNNITPKPALLPAATINGSQLQTPCLEFSGACAGCGETPYVKLLTQLFGSHLIIANATGCSSIWGADFPSNPYCTTPTGQGPAWGNSLFEDNAEYGYGILLSMIHRRSHLVNTVTGLIQSPDTPAYLKAPLQAWLTSRNDAELASHIASQLIDMSTPLAPNNAAIKSLLDQSDMLRYKSVWTIGGDGWAYDIGFAGLDHVLAQGDPVKILVMDTECYSNTGGQMSKATPRGAMAKYAPDGKSTIKKDLGRMMMTYGNVYVASVALGANYQQTIDALVEAERYPGPAIVIAYCPCLNHGIRPGLGHSIIEQRRAVESGYWPLYRYNPANCDNPLTIDHVIPGPDNSGSNGSNPEVTSPGFSTFEPLELVSQYINQEDRYADLRADAPQRAATLQPELQRDCNLLRLLLTRGQ